MVLTKYQFCHCDSKNGFEECYCLSPSEKKMTWLYHQEKDCCNENHRIYLKGQNGYVLMEQNNFCVVKESKTFTVTKSRYNFPCEKEGITCDCIQKHRKVFKNLCSFYATHKHRQSMFCQNKNHENWHSTEHYYVGKSPVWPHLCHQPFKGKFITEILKLCKIFNLVCNCQNEKVCLLCWRISQCQSLTWSKTGGSMSLLFLLKLFPFIKWNDIKLHPVAFNPLWNQDGTRNG